MQTSVKVVGPYSYQLHSEMPGDQLELTFTPTSTLVKLYNVSISLCCGAKFGTLPIMKQKPSCR